MSAFAWYYNSGNRIYYWTESYTMSATQFAREVSERTGRSLSASDISVASNQADVDSMKARASQVIYIA